MNAEIKETRYKIVNKVNGKIGKMTYLSEESAHKAIKAMAKDAATTKWYNDNPYTRQTDSREWNNGLDAFIEDTIKVYLDEWVIEEIK